LKNKFRENKIVQRLAKKEWLRAAGVRAYRTFFQALSAGLIGTIALSEVDWRVAISTAIMAAVISLIHSLGGIPEVNEKAHG